MTQDDEELQDYWESLRERSLDCITKLAAFGDVSVEELLTKIEDMDWEDKDDA